MTGKKIVSLLLAFVLLFGLCACAKSNVKADSNWFEDSLLINTAFTREALSKSPLISTDDYDDAITAWTDLYVEKNYASGTVDTNVWPIGSFTLSTRTGEKLYFLTAMCQTEFTSAVAPKGLEYGDHGYRIKFQTVIQCTKSFRPPFTLVGFVTNQERQIIEPCELYDFIKDIPTYKDDDFIVPKPMNPVPLDSLGDDFTEKR